MCLLRALYRMHPLHPILRIKFHLRYRIPLLLTMLLGAEVVQSTVEYGNDLAGVIPRDVQGRSAAGTEDPSDRVAGVLCAVVVRGDE